MESHGTTRRQRTRRNRRIVTRTLLTLSALVAVSSASYVVELGDTLSAIAQRLGTTVAALVDANDLADPDRIYAGQRLDVPEAGAAPAVSASRNDAEALIEQVSNDWNWNPAFVKALAWLESGWRSGRTSSAGAIGIMQVMPGTGDFVSRQLVGRDLDLHDPHDNVTAGVAFLNYLWGLTGRDVEMTLGGYYQGLGSIRANGMYADTERYIANVLALRERF